MQPAEELLPYTLVASHRRFHPHENPLFAYLVDHYSQLKRDEIKTNPGFEHMEEWDKDGRKALFFHLAFVPVDFPVFQNFDLTDLHLSVDYKLIDTDSIPQRKLPPHHVSLIYINSKIGEKITVRIEYTERCNLIYAKLQHLDGSLEYPSLTAIQKEHLLLQAISSQQLLQNFLHANQQTQYQLLLEVEDLDNQLKNDSVLVESILLELITRLTKYSRYSGYWDGRIDIYQSYLSKLHTIDTPIPMKENSEEATSEPINAEMPLRSSVQKQKPKNWEQLIVTHIDTWLDQTPIDALDSTAVTAWIKTHIENFAVLDELCLCHFWNSPTSSAQPFIQAQWQRLPTRGRLLDYFTRHLFLGHSELIRDIAPLLHDTTELYQIYMRFLHSIEQETELRTQRIATAHVLYDSSPLYKNVLMSKRYTLSDDGENLLGILINLFLKDNFEVFCMYVDQDMASDSGLQCLLPGIPYHTICLFYAHPRATAYLEKLFSRQTNILLPHIENLDLSLYQIQDKKIIRHKANT